MISAPSNHSRSTGMSRSSASSRTERPSGVSSAKEAMIAPSNACSTERPPTGVISDALRFPNVIVPVLSKMIVWISPAASTAFPLIAMTLKRVTRSIPAMPIADSKPPIVVGIKQTSKAIKIGPERLNPR